MREILFRGKTLNGLWVYGDLLNGGYDYDAAIREKHDKAVTRVFPETVGQFAGLTDKNGKKVFEGDILKFTDVPADYEWIGRVEFGNPNEEYNWGFQLVYIKGEKPNTDILCWFDMEEAGAFAEVIGNIHDNPELLEG